MLAWQGGPIRLKLAPPDRISDHRVEAARWARRWKAWLPSTYHIDGRVSDFYDHATSGIRIERSQRGNRVVRVVSHRNDLSVKQGHAISLLERLTVPCEFLTHRRGDPQVAFLFVHFHYFSTTRRSLGIGFRHHAGF